jgi:cbb3-type cytochrome oxidase subunit 1
MAEKGFGYLTEKGSLSHRFFWVIVGLLIGILISLRLDYLQFKLTS